MCPSNSVSHIYEFSFRIVTDFLVRENSMEMSWVEVSSIDIICESIMCCKDGQLWRGEDECWMWKIWKCVRMELSTFLN